MDPLNHEDWLADWEAACRKSWADIRARDESSQEWRWRIHVAQEIERVIEASKAGV